MKCENCGKKSKGFIATKPYCKKCYPKAREQHLVKLGKKIKPKYFIEMKGGKK